MSVVAVCFVYSFLKKGKRTSLKPDEKNSRCNAP